MFIQCASRFLHYSWTRHVSVSSLSEAELNSAHTDSQILSDRLSPSSAGIENPAYYALASERGGGASAAAAGTPLQQPRHDGLPAPLRDIAVQARLPPLRLLMPTVPLPTPLSPTHHPPSLLAPCFFLPLPFQPILQSASRQAFLLPSVGIRSGRQPWPEAAGVGNLSGRDLRHK